MLDTPKPLRFVYGRRRINTLEVESYVNIPELETTRNLFLFPFYYLTRSSIWGFKLPTMSTDQPTCSWGKSWLYHMCPQTARTRGWPERRPTKPYWIREKDMDKQQSMESNHLVRLSKVGSIPKSILLLTYFEFYIFTKKNCKKVFSTFK